MKYVVISSNKNPDYEFYLPLVEWAWNRLGWDVIIMYPFNCFPYKEETITQCMRLYVASLSELNLLDDDLLMTSDADMIPLADYWKPNPNEITAYGHDLTGYQHVPMCYIAMNVANWKKVMNLTNDMNHCMQRDLADSKALSPNKTEWWGVDQDIITERLSRHTVTKIDRSIEPNSYLPKGRFDRASMQYPKTPLIDFHAPREGWKHFDKIKEVITKAFGSFPDELLNMTNGYM